MTFAFGSFTLGAALLYSAFTNISLVQLIMGEKGKSVAEQGETHPSENVATGLPEGQNIPSGGIGPGSTGGVSDTFGGFKIPAGTPNSKAARLAKAAGWIAANSHRWPYCWGGGHNTNIEPVGQGCKGYDCSGCWSKILRILGVPGMPMVSGEMASSFQKGKGKYITLYANAGHVWGYFLGVPVGTGSEAEGANRGGFAIGNGDTNNKGAYVECHPKGW